MNHTKAVLYQVKPGQLPTWQKWCDELRTTHHAEAARIVRAEGIDHEFFTSFSLGSADY